MRALVTGGAGYIGSHVVRALVGDGVDVRALHLPGETLSNLDGLDIELMPGDITDRATMAKAVKGCTWVFHTAAIYALWLPDLDLMRKVNVDGTRVVLEAARDADVERVVHTSTCAVFAGQPGGAKATEESEFALADTGDPYVLTKFAAHQVALRAAASGQHVVLACPTVPVGPGDIRPTPTGKLILTAATAPAFALPASIANVVDVRDVARGHVLAARHGRSGESYILGNEDMPATELVRRVHRLLGTRRPIITIPGIIDGVVSQLAGHAALAVTERVTRKPPPLTPSTARISQRGAACDCGKALRELDLPQSDIKTALRDALVWFAEHGHLSPGRVAALRAG